MGCNGKMQAVCVCAFPFLLIVLSAPSIRRCFVRLSRLVRVIHCVCMCVSLRVQQEEKKDEEGEKEVLKPNYEKSGALFEAENKIKGVSTDYAEPEEARLCPDKWRMYVFKGEEKLDPLALHRQTMYMFGRDGRISDIRVDHPSCSKQHAVLQYRQIAGDAIVNDEGPETTVKPYLLDLGSTNGTFLNGVRLESARYYEIKTNDVIKFGLSTREYVTICIKGADKQTNEHTFKGMHKGLLDKEEKVSEQRLAGGCCKIGLCFYPVS